MVSGESIKQNLPDFKYPDGTAISFIDIKTTETVRRDDCLTFYVDFPPLPEQKVMFEAQIEPMINNKITCKTNPTNKQETPIKKF